MLYIDLLVGLEMSYSVNHQGCQHEYFRKMFLAFMKKNYVLYIICSTYSNYCGIN